MKYLKHNWKEFVGDPSEYIPHLFAVITFILIIYVVGLTFYSYNL